MLSAPDMSAEPEIDQIDEGSDILVPQIIERFTNDLRGLQVESEDSWPLDDAVGLIVHLEKVVMLEPDIVSKEFAAEKSRAFTSRLRRILGKADQRTYATNGVLLFLCRFLSGLQRTDEERRAEYEIENIEIFKRRLDAIHQTLTQNPNAYGSSRQLFSVVLSDIENTLSISRSPKSMDTRLRDIATNLPSISITTRQRVLGNHSRDINMVEESLLRESGQFTELELRHFGQIVASITCPQEIAQIEAWLFGQEYNLGIINDDEFNGTLSGRLTNVLLMAVSDVGNEQMQNTIRDLLGTWFANAESFIRRQRQDTSAAESRSGEQPIQETQGDFGRRLLLTLAPLVRRIFPQAPR